MKKKNTSLYLVFIATLALMMSGCGSDKQYAANKDTHFLGLMKSRPGSFDTRDTTAITLKTDEITTQDNISGDEVSLVWGLIRFQDY